MMHLNELPLRHLFVNLDGTTLGPQGFSGEIGKELKNVNELEVVNFNPIDFEVPEVNNDTLSKDQKYLHKIAFSIKMGCLSESLQKAEPGVLNHARWLTLANRVSRLYFSKTFLLTLYKF